MGKSRSATCVIAYLMQKYHISPEEALAQIRQSRPMCEPNEGFMEQLQLYHGMQTPEKVEDDPTYQRWLYKREVEMSNACGQAPEAEKIRFEDEYQMAKDAAAEEFTLRCRKCRRALATSQFLVNHKPKQAKRDGKNEPAPPLPASTCAHYFLDPLSWMRPELEQGKLEGRLECPKCKTNVGKYAWQGMPCSCGGWVLPAISLSKARTDEVKSSPATGADGSGIRRPPGVVNPRSNGQENL